jgi:hypothetical protein
VGVVCVTAADLQVEAMSAHAAAQAKGAAEVEAALRAQLTAATAAATHAREAERGWMQKAHAADAAQQVFKDAAAAAAAQLAEAVAAATTERGRLEHMAATAAQVRAVSTCFDVALHRMDMSWSSPLIFSPSTVQLQST